jgi:hypothetical protein
LKPRNVVRNWGRKYQLVISASFGFFFYKVKWNNFTQAFAKEFAENEIFKAKSLKKAWQSYKKKFKKSILNYQDDNFFFRLAEKKSKRCRYIFLTDFIKPRFYKIC